MAAPQGVVVAIRAIDVLRALAKGCASLAMMRHVMAMFPAHEKPTDKEICDLLHESQMPDQETERNVFRLVEHDIPALHVGYAFKRHREGPPSFFMDIARKCGAVCPERDHNPSHIIVMHCRWLGWRDAIAILDALRARGVCIEGGCRKHACCGLTAMYTTASHARINQYLWFAGISLDHRRIYTRDTYCAHSHAQMIGALIILLARRKQLHLPADLIRRYIAPHLKRHAK